MKNSRSLPQPESFQEKKRLSFDCPDESDYIQAGQFCVSPGEGENIEGSLCACLLQLQKVKQLMILHMINLWPFL